MPTSYRAVVAEIVASAIIIVADRVLRSLTQPEPDSSLPAPPPPPVVLTTLTERSP